MSDSGFLARAKRQIRERTSIDRPAIATPDVAGETVRPFRVTAAEAHRAGVADTELGAVLFEMPRQVHKWVHYLEAYEREFAQLREKPVRMLEIGVAGGGSLQMWRDYFRLAASYSGIDINPDCAQIDNDEGVHVRIGPQDDPEFLRGVVAEMGGVDIVLDDGSHQAKHQIASFRTLFPLLADGGIYVVEDLHTSYWRKFGGAYGSGGGFIETAKELVDDMHGWYHAQPMTHPEAAAKTCIPRVTFYDSMVFIHKREHGKPVHFGSRDASR